ncbi:KGGVGR-motif variant AAA ATPase [Pseudomonas aeruginosa]|uniref:KGGVGR-motif variant AAA ATPase n=1 Tax=Pseudomonas aeruginosa TaxID=287 RepID=UPI001F373C1F|nr:AAA family ATPase [Pseudomonas aeruginosa]HBN9930698.1 ParA family protein [Pseudomonas aeruginosa]HCL3939754.1 ParA family protein [Pseudomonas aeruginosa]
MYVRFDDAISYLVQVIVDTLSEDFLADGVVLRDVSGRLSFFSSRELEDKKIEAVSNLLRNTLGNYAAKDRVLVCPSHFGAQRILSEKNYLAIRVENKKVRLVDRRIVGADWLRRPVLASAPPPRFVFSSIKGGVGRSTALTVVASSLANQGLRVLAIDLDIEAPGLGPILLDEETLPEFGLIDALVENGISGLDSKFYADLIGPSSISKGRGKIDVIPVLGRRSLKNPSEVLAKIARAYMEDVNEDGTVSTILDQIGSIVEEFSDPKRYDAILVDARAGLHETTASAILGLGAEVFLFGLDEPQTFQGFSMLLSHMTRLNDEKVPAEWLSRFTIVQGKAPTESNERQRFSDKCQRMLQDLGLIKSNSPVEVKSTNAGEEFNDYVWNDEALDEEVLPFENASYSEPLAILDDPKFKGFNPQAHPDLLESGIYTASYSQLLEKVRTAIPVERFN